MSDQLPTLAGQQCANCDANLHGPYCAQCGQHAHHSARTLGTLLHDGWHTLTHIDSRAWRSFKALLLRPGQLTVEYLADHRERYLPPVRLYLISALFFFALVGIGGGPTNGSGAAAKPAATGNAEPCTIDAEDRADNDPGWMTDSALAACRAFQRQDLDELTRHWKENVPRMMLIFLPVMAAICLLYYWRPRRLYVEHLVFFLHTHSALYLLALLVSLVNRLLRLWTVTSGVAGLLTFLAIVYSGWYLYRAMRRTYGQGRWLTLVKFVLVGFSYGICLAVMLALAYVWPLIAARLNGA